MSSVWGEDDLIHLKRLELKWFKRVNEFSRIANIGYRAESVKDWALKYSRRDGKEITKRRGRCARGKKSKKEKKISRKLDKK